LKLVYIALPLRDHPRGRNTIGKNNWGCTYDT
jgi:hypothetical protein